MRSCLRLNPAAAFNDPGQNRKQGHRQRPRWRWWQWQMRSDRHEVSAPVRPCATLLSRPRSDHSAARLISRRVGLAIRRTPSRRATRQTEGTIHSVQKPLYFRLAQNHRQSRGATRAKDALEIAQATFQDHGIQEKQCAECLVLGAGCDVPCHHQVFQELSHFSFSEAPCRNRGLASKCRSNTSIWLWFEMPVVDAVCENFLSLSHLVLVPIAWGWLAQCNVVEESGAQHFDRSLELLVADEGQNALNVDTPPVEFVTPERNPLVGPEAQEPRRIGEMGSAVRTGRTKWLNFSGKVLGALGVWNRSFTIPPFHPNRIKAQTVYRLSQQKEYEQIQAPPLHVTQSSSQNLNRKLTHATDSRDWASRWCDREDRTCNTDIRTGGERPYRTTPVGNLTDFAAADSARYRDDGGGITR